MSDDGNDAILRYIYSGTPIQGKIIFILKQGPELLFIKW